MGAWNMSVPCHRYVTGPMTLSAVVHLTGLTASKPPAELVALAQVVIGVAAEVEVEHVAMLVVTLRDVEAEARDGLDVLEAADVTEPPRDEVRREVDASAGPGHPLN